MGAHALLAPSSAKRWMTCAPSARLEATVPDKSTSFSREGSIAHGMAEFILGCLLVEKYDHVPDNIAGLIREIQSGKPVSTMARGLVKHIELAEGEGLDAYEMLETVYENYCRLVYESYLGAQLEDPDAELFIEARLHLSEFIPEGFGSSDAVIIYSDTMEVFDLKYGKGVKVDATNNPQMMCYALGAYLGPAETFNINLVKMTIIQPRLRHESTFEMSTADLMIWAFNELKPAAEKAFRGDGEQVPGEHCRFCKVAAQCRKLADHTLKVSKEQTEPGLMSIEELAQLLPHFETIKKWMASVEEFALEQALEGKNVPGFKVVEGRSVRKISDNSAAIAKLDAAGILPENYLKPAELKTITDLEKMLTKKGFNAILGGLVIKPEGKPALVSVDDPRQPYSKANQDFKDIIENL